jgi:putative transposase
VWKSLKYECIYLNEFDSVAELRFAIDKWIDFYNNIRPHSVFGGKSPLQIYSKQANYSDVLSTNLVA